MNQKTLALLFVTFTTTAFTATAAEQKKATTTEEKKPTCMQELQKGKGVKANMAASIKCQERAIGRLAVAGVLEGDNLKAVLDKQKEFDSAFAAANKDKKISAEERKELQALRKAANSAVFESVWDEDAVATRLEKMKKSIYAGETKGQLTAGEMQTIVEKFNDLEAKFTKLKAGGLSTEEKKKLREELRALHKTVYDDKRDHEGNVAPTPDRDKDGIDEVRRNLAARVVACYSNKKNSGAYAEQFAAIDKVRHKESGYLADGTLSKEETADLTQLYKKTAMDLNSVCGEKKAIRVDDSGMRPKDKAVDDSGLVPGGTPKSDTPAEPTKKVDIGL